MFTIKEQIRCVVFFLTPHHLISRITYLLSRIRTPLVRFVIRGYIRAFKVDMEDAAEPNIKAYRCFDDFFIRKLKPDARPIYQEENALVSPCDGTVFTHARISSGTLYQAKDYTYTVAELLADQDTVQRFQHGHILTMYLSPADCHRVHMPLSGTLQTMIHIPGRLFSVSHYALYVIPRLYVRNERVVSVFETEHGLMAVVMIGAINVGCIETSWHGIVTPKRASHTKIDYRPGQNNGADSQQRPIKLERGEEMGRFHLGSAIIVLHTASDLLWERTVMVMRHMKMGEAVAFLGETPP